MIPECIFSKSWRIEKIMNRYKPILPPKKRFKTFIIKLVFFFLGRGFQVASRIVPSIQDEIMSWEEGFTIMMKVASQGPEMIVQKKSNRLHYLRKKTEDCDLMVRFKNTESAFMLFDATIRHSRSLCPK